MKRLHVILIFLILSNVFFAQQPKLVLPSVSNNLIDFAFITSSQRYLIASVLGKGNSSSEIKVWDYRSKTLLYTIKNNAIFNKSNCLSLDEKILITSDEMKVNVWNLIDETLAFSIPESKFIEYASFSHDGKMIVTSTLDSLKIWDATDGHFLFSLNGESKNGYPVNFSPNDKYILSCECGLIKVWNATTSELVSSYQAASDRMNNPYSIIDQNMVKDFRFSEDSRYFITDFYDGTVYVRDLLESKEIELVKEKTLNVDISRDGKTIAIIRNNWLNIYDVPSQKIVFTYQINAYAPPIVSLGNSNRYFLLTNNSFTTLFTIPNGQQVEKIQTNNSIIPPPPLLTNNDSFLIYQDRSKWAGILVNTIRQGKSIGIADKFTWQSRKLDIGFSNNYDTIISSSDDSSIRVWNYKKGESSNTYKLQAKPYITSKYIFYVKEQINFSVNSNDTVFVLNPFTGLTLKKIFVKNCRGKLFISPDSKIIVSDEGMLSNKLKIIDINSGKVIKTLHKSSGNPVEDLFFLPNSKKFVVTDQILPESAEIFDIHKGRLKYKLKNYVGEGFSFSDFIHDISFSPNGRFVAVASEYTLKVSNIPGNKSVKEFNYEMGVSVSAFSPDNRYFAYGLKDGTLLITNASDFSAVKSLKLNSSYIYKIIFSEDSKYLLYADNIGNIYLLETNLFTPVKQILVGKSDLIQSVDFKKKVIFVSDGSIITLYNIDSEKKLFSFGSFLNDDFIFLWSNNYYYTTPSAASILTWKINGNVYSFNQFDTKYNRPDIVLENLGELYSNADTVLIDSYRKAYEKRMRKLGIVNPSGLNDLNVPQADFVNRDSIVYEQKNKELVLHIKGSDSISILDRFNVWINEVPLFGESGISLKKTNSKRIDTTITIILSQDENKIETSVSNTNGNESFRKPLFIKCNPEKPQEEKLYFIGIGIDKFEDNRYNLKYSTKDIRDLCFKLKEKYNANIYIDTLFDENVTINNVRALKQRLQKTSENDKVIISYSGHGLLSKEYDYYLSTYFINFEKPEQNGLSYAELEHLLDSIPSRKKLLLIDACHSGEVDKDEILAMNKDANSMGLKGSQLLEIDSPAFGLKNSFEVMQSLFVYVGKNTGSIIISAAAGNQFALEGGDFKNGVFTYAILEAMKNYPTLKISELKKIVGERVVQLTNGLQKPTSRNGTIAVDWSIW